MTICFNLLISTLVYYHVISSWSYSHGSSRAMLSLVASIGRVF